MHSLWNTHTHTYTHAHTPFSHCWHSGIITQTLRRAHTHSFVMEWSFMAAFKILPTQRSDSPLFLLLLTLAIRLSLCFSSPFVVISGSVFLSSCCYAFYTGSSTFNSSVFPLPLPLPFRVFSPFQIFHFHDFSLFIFWVFPLLPHSSFGSKCLGVVNILYD